MTDNYRILIEKLDGFIRKYYHNLVIRGGIYSLSSLLVFFLLFNIIEYFAYFGSVLRALLFFSFIFLNTFIIIRFILIPFFKIYKLGKIISNEQAARIIGTHFTEIGDKLLNVLQLKKMEDNSPYTHALIEAGVNQKINSIKPFPFQKAVNFKENRKYLKFAIIPLFVLTFLLLASPAVITDPTKRIVNYNTFYEKEAPFTITIENQALTTVQNEDFILKVKVTGSEIPSEIYIESDAKRFLLQKQSNSTHTYTFRNLQKSFLFNFYAAGYTSSSYELKVLPKPIILNFDVRLSYPSYIGKKDELLNNTGDMNVPAGTQLSWMFSTRDTRSLTFKINNEALEVESLKENYFSFSRRFLSNSTYTVVSSNEFMTSPDSLSYAISVIPDAFPEITAEEFRDSVLDNNLYFRGQIKDDYGFKKLTFSYRVLNDNKQSTPRTSSININTSLTIQQFYHHFDISSVDYTPGDIIEYYFEVWDNDGVNGSKSSRTRTMHYKTLSQKEIQEKTDNKAQQLKQNMQSALKNAQKIQKSIDDLNKKMLDKKSLNWQDKQSIEQLLELNKELQKQTEDIHKAFEEKEQWENQFKEINEEILRKQEELNKLLEQLMTDEMKKLMEELEKTLDKLDKEKVKEMLDKMKMDTKDVEKELDRSIELMKQFELEKKLSETIEKLDKLTEEQQKLTEKTENKEAENKKLNEEQEKLNEKFEDIKKSLDDIDKKNQELEKPNNLERTDKEQQSISEEMKKSSDQLQKNNNKKASESQKNASEQMQQLSDKLKEMEADMLEENLAEDIDALRDILENLLRTSFSQEEIMLALSKTRTNDPKYVALMQEQNKIKDDLKMIEDSLYALSKRQTQIQSFVNAEIADINSNLEKAIQWLVDRNTHEATGRQQYVMTHVNNLALMLDETLQSMQMQMNANPSGNCKKSCKKPSGGQQSFKSLRQMQEALNKMMQDLKDGKMPDGKSGQQSLSEQMARMAAQQEAIRNHLKALSDELKKQGQGNSKDMEKLQQQMEQSESDIVNKLISPETLKRQQDILTRLLEHEKAEREREMDDQRESAEVKNQKYSNPVDFFKYNNLKSKEEELLKTIPPSFRNFYKNKVNEYFHNFQE